MALRLLIPFGCSGGCTPAMALTVRSWAFVPREAVIMKKCSDLMTVDLRWISSTATALEAAQVMRENSIGFLPICDPVSGQLVAVITDRDLVTRMVAMNGVPSETPVLTVATSGPISCREDSDISVAEAAMQNFQISRVVVVDALARPVGVLSLTDILMGERDRRALSTARGVLEREAYSPQPSAEGLRLTPSEPAPAARDRDEQDPVDIYERSTTAVNREAVIIGGRDTRDMKEFPR
jgi:CBS domain-containing protein